MNVTQVGSNVVAAGSGSINLGGLVQVGTLAGEALIDPRSSYELAGSGPADAYSSINGPGGFGDGLLQFATSATGDFVGIFGVLHQLLVPAGYTSGASLSDTATYANQTLSTLGLLPGSYVYTFGSGANADTFTIKIGATATPEPASLALLGAGLVGLGLVRRRPGGPEQASVQR